MEFQIISIGQKCWGKILLKSESLQNLSVCIFKQCTRGVFKPVRPPRKIGFIKTHNEQFISGAFQ